jgi:hypothetical protein
VARLFDRKPAAEKPWSAKPHQHLKLWIYDRRTNKHFTLKEWSSGDIDWRSVSPQGQICRADQNPLKRVRCPLELPGFPRHTRKLGASRRKAGFPASANLDDFVIAGPP